MKRDLIIFVMICLSFYLGATMTQRVMKINQHTAISNAIATFEPSPLNCDDQSAIEAIKSLAENGAHISRFDIEVYWAYKEEQ